MKKIMSLTILLSALTLQSINKSTSASIDSLAHNLCCYLFGKEEACKEVQDYFHGAALDFKMISQYHPVKYINSCPFLQQFSGFTWSGSWVNEKAWKEMSSEEKEWDAHHETAHTLLQHPQKQLLVAGLTVLLTSLFNRTLKLNTLPSLFTMASSLAFVTSRYARQCEKNADLATAKSLLCFNRKDIIDAHIQNLAQQPNNFSLWFYSPEDQINYLENDSV